MRDGIIECFLTCVLFVSGWETMIFVLFWKKYTFEIKTINNKMREKDGKANPIGPNPIECCVTMKVPGSCRFDGKHFRCHDSCAKCKKIGKAQSQALKWTSTLHVKRLPTIFLVKNLSNGWRYFITYHKCRRRRSVQWR